MKGSEGALPVVHTEVFKFLLSAITPLEDLALWAVSWADVNSIALSAPLPQSYLCRGFREGFEKAQVPQVP